MKNYPLGSNSVRVKAHNLQAVLLSLLKEEGLSRVDLAHRTALSGTTITNLVAELLEQGIVAEEGVLETHGPRGVGRPRTGLCLIPNARFAIGVHIGIGLYRIAITNLYAEIIYGSMHEFKLEQPAEAVFDTIAADIETAIQQSGIARAFIIGIGVGASGLVSIDTGVNILAPRLGWANVPIQSFLSQRLGLPVLIENNVRAMALGEAHFGVGRDISSLAFVYGRVGVGAGFVVNGQIFHGKHSGAGEIGHMIMSSEGGELCKCGKRGCLETLVSEVRLAQQAELAAAGHPNSRLAQVLREPGSASPLERVLAAAQAGDDTARQVLECQARHLGIALANLVNLFNPELILLGGMFAQAGEFFLPVVTQTVEENAFAGLGERSQIQLTSFGWRAGVIGAASLPLIYLFYSESV